MLSFTRKTDYALISLAHMVRQQGVCCSAREIATHYGMPMPLLMNVLKMLNQHGITRSVRGPKGGYQLAKPPEQIALYDIIAAVDGPVALVLCLEKPGCQSSTTAMAPAEQVGDQEPGKSEPELMRPKNCDLTSVCPVRGQVHRVHHRLVGFLKAVSLADIAQKGVPLGEPLGMELESLVVSEESSGELAHAIADLHG